MAFLYRHRSARRAFIGLLTLFGILFVGPMLIPSSVLEKRIAAAVEKATGRKLAINGGVALWLLPRPGALAERVVLSNAPWEAARPMLSVALIEVNLRVLPLLLGRVELDSVDVVAPTLNLAVNSDGQRNWTFVRGTPAPESAVSAETTQPAAATPAATAAPSTPSTPSASPTSLPAPAASSPRTPPLATDFARLVPRVLRIANGIITYRSDVSGEHFRLSGVSLALSPGTADSLVAAAGLSWNGKPVDASLRFEDWAQLLAGRRSDFSASVTSSVAQLDLKGNAMIAANPALDATIALHIAPPAEDTPRLLARLGSLAVTARVAIADKRITLTEFSAQRGDASVAAHGQISAELSGPHPSISGYLEFGRLDLDPLLPPAAAEADEGPVPPPANQAAKGPPREWPDAPLRLAPLHSWQADLTLKGGPITLRGIEFGPSSFHVSIGDGHANAELQETAVGTGQLAFTAAIEPGEAGAVSARLQLSAKTFPVDALAGFGRRSLRAGAISVQAAVASQGISQRALIANLAGEARVTVTDGSFGLARILERIGLTMPSCPRIADHAAADAQIDIRDGVLAVAAANFHAVPLDLAATGAVDLPQRHLALRVSARPGSCTPGGLLEGPWNNLSLTPAAG